jgi:hypothetical protein
MYGVRVVDGPIVAKLRFLCRPPPRRDAKAAAMHAAGIAGKGLRGVEIFSGYPVAARASSIFPCSVFMSPVFRT